MIEEAHLHLFEGFGIELEYMIVSRRDLSVLAVADEVLKELAGEYTMEVALGDVAWSNELALHVIELKTNGPTPTLAGLGQRLQQSIGQINDLLNDWDAQLLPTAMHPTMRPERELKLWPHDNDIIYKTFDRIFGCTGHGWSNLQSMHVNLPFANDREFGQLHAAIRLVLPILSGLAASSPFTEGRLTGDLDTRLEIYRTNSIRVPAVAGIVIPERVFTRKDYEQGLLQSIYRALAPHDPDGVLHHEWVNARGCIARFDRFAIEIRLIDVQECPRADIAVAAAVVAAVRGLVEETWCSTREQQAWDERQLAVLFRQGIRDADEAVIDDRRFLQTFGYPDPGRARVRELWQHLIETGLAKEDGYDEWREPLDNILKHGCLARRIIAATGEQPSDDEVRSVYERLSGCLRHGELFST